MTALPDSPSRPDAQQRRLSIRTLRTLSAFLAVPYFLSLYQLLIVPTVPAFGNVRAYSLRPLATVSALIAGSGSLQHKAFVLLGNTLVFAPLAMLIALWLPRLHVWIVYLLGLVVVLAFEAYQYLAPTWREADIDAVLLGAAGFVVAHAATTWLLPRAAK